MDGELTEVLAAMGLSPRGSEPITRGLIHQTHRVDTLDGRTFVLQRVHPIFPPEIHVNIRAVTEHLAEKGLVTPRLHAAPDGALWVERGGAVWRALSFVPGSSIDRVTRPSEAEAAGRALGRFHVALADLAHEFVRPRNIHDTRARVRDLEAALAAHPDHDLYEAVAPAAARALALFERHPILPASPRRIVHGDPKINNLLFAPGTVEPLAWVDLDTVGPMEAPLELGDALRSWCNPKGEDDPTAALDLELFAAALVGYRDGSAGFLPAEELAAIPRGVLQIQLELACRFLADALEERYFGWDPKRFPRRGEHNLVRGLGQLALAESTSRRLGEAEAIAARTFAGGLPARPRGAMREPMSERTIFARIIDREIPATVVYEDDRCLAFRDLHPQAPTHVLFVPKQAIDRIQSMTAADEALVGHLFRAAGEWARSRGISDFRLVVNNGAGAGQSVFHLHVHLLAGRGFDWPPG